MGYLELYVSPTLNFSGYQKPFKSSKYVVVGVPFDVTSTFRTGARFAPSAIREASLNIETYSFQSNFDVEDLKIHDLGDLHATSNVKETLMRIERVTQELLEKGKIPVIVGGEHTITLGAVKAANKIYKNLGIISLDAHLDLRSKYMGLRISHTTFMRRINEQTKPTKIFELGTRATCKEEMQYVKNSKNIEFIVTQRLQKENMEKIVEYLEKSLKECEKLYLSIDMDVLDPAFAPAVQNPEPGGLSTLLLLELLNQICDKRIIALDLVEVTPPYDSGVTALTAAKILFEILSSLDSS